MIPTLPQPYSSKQYTTPGTPSYKPSRQLLVTDEFILDMQLNCSVIVCQALDRLLSSKSVVIENHVAGFLSEGLVTHVTFHRAKPFFAEIGDSYN